MPVFEYAGFDAKGKPVRGQLDTDSPKALRTTLKRTGVIITEVKQQAAGPVRITTGNQQLQRSINQWMEMLQIVSVEQLSMATRQLAVMLASGMPLVEALTSLVETTEGKALQRMVSQVKTDVNEGMSLADAMQKHRAFDKVYVNLVRAGESSGTLDTVLERLADFKESQAKMKGEVLGALMYPAIMVLMGMGNIALMFTVVIPKITKIFEHAKVQLPWTTRLLMFISNSVAGYWWLMIAFAAASVWGFVRWLRTPKGRETFDSFKLGLPFFGDLTRTLAMARFARTLSTLLSSGVPLLTCLDIVRNVVDNERLAKAVDKTRDAVREGEDIHVPLKRAGEFPTLLVSMVAVGERSGQLEQMLGRVATSYEQRADVRMKAAMSLLSPLLILGMGLSVGFIVFAILTPIMQMNSLVK
jgi:general secretion pathway protein F